MHESCGAGILEITGVPGAGKSTFAREIAPGLPDGWVLFSDAMMPGARLFGRRGAQVVVLGYFLLGLFSCRIHRWGQLRFVWRGARGASNSLVGRFYLFFNMVFKMGRHEYLVRQKNWRGVLVDEGISHLPFNMTDYRTNGKIADPSVVFACFSDMLEGTGVLFVDAPDEEIARHLEIRGHRRLPCADQRQIELFVDRNQQLGWVTQEAAREYASFFAVVNAEDHEAGRRSIADFIKGVGSLGG